MTDPFTIGDTVALRSGGTAMVVDEMKPDGVKCTWMDESGEDRAAIFNPRCLARVSRCQAPAESGMYRYIWVFAETGFPTVDHILTAYPLVSPQLIEAEPA